MRQAAGFRPHFRQCKVVVLRNSESAWVSVVRSSDIPSRWRDCGFIQGMGGAASSGREFRNVDWCDWGE
jgi:hypothetical protein